MAHERRLPGIHTPTGAVRFVRSLAADPCRAVEELHHRYGPVAAVSAGVGRPPLVLLFGRDANELVLSTGIGHFSWRKAYTSLIPVDGDTALVVSDGDDHHRRRRLVQPAFHRRTIDGYLDVMVDEADRTITAWTAGATIDGYEELRRSVRRTVIRTLFGEHLRDRADEIGDLLQPALDFVNRPPQRQVRLDVPGSGYRRARRARRAVDQVIDAEVERRRHLGCDQPDTLGLLLATHDEDGDGLSPEELRDQVVSLIAAGYDTTSASLGWAVHHLASDPGVRTRLRAELDDVVGDRPLEAADLPALPYLDGVVHETLRLHPAAPVGARRAVEPFAFAGHHIPAGPLVMYSPWVTQRDPDLWPDPLAFRPERWVPTHPDYREPVPYSFVTFGGGPRRCLGFAFATLEMKVLLSRLVQLVEFEARGQGKPVRAGIASVHPSGGVPVRVHPVHRLVPS